MPRATPPAPTARPAPARRPSPPRGRPAATPEALETQRRRLLDATRTVYGLTGYHGLTLDKVLALAGVSRPTFHKHFQNVRAAVDQVLQELAERLIAGLIVAVIDLDDGVAAIEAALEAWRRWSGELGPLLRPIFAELHDPRSPVSAQRERALTLIADSMAQVAERVGRPRPTRLQMDALIHGVEYLGFRFHLEPAGDATSWKQTRDAMLRLAIGLLGTREEWGHALQLAQALDVELEPRDPA
ncbi:MAG TPA: TetR/AcrR family transcriptional regulator [Moraxellaceae bacterium]|nr:TetR/AcrR family transcriptional regulator [Moraxellaceae bacterium]